jgi:hypothetical protein
LGPLGTAAANRPIVSAPGEYDDGEIGGMIGRGNRCTRRKPATLPLCPPQTPHAARTRTRAATVRSQRLTARATARPAQPSSTNCIFLQNSVFTIFHLPVMLPSLKANVSSICLSVCLAICLSIYDSITFVNLGRFSSFLIHEQSAGVHGRGMIPSQGRYLHTEQQKHRITYTDIHASTGIRTYDPSVRAVEDGSCFRLRGHCGRNLLRVAPFSNI